ncbi:MAG: hypothetical protein WAN11_27790 [Syntrophobacteraceae bacterium]
MPENLTDKIKRWARDANAPADFLRIWEEIESAAKRFSEYHPTISPASDFMTRLDQWIDNVMAEEDRQTLFRLVTKLFFVGTLEFNALYSAAFNGPIMRWLIDTLNLDISNLDQSVINDAINTTWFCPITDSMSISAFHHVNRITGKEYRPDWRSLHKFGSRDRILEYMNTNRLNKLVLLEDFIGIGEQSGKVLTYAANVLRPMNVLIVPLIICPAGYETFTNVARAFNNLSFEPVLLLEEEAFVFKAPQLHEDNLTVLIRSLVQRLYYLLQDTMNQLNGPFGFGDTGGLIVMYSNCPDNTLPIIHAKSDAWKPLFPRSSRIWF